MSDRTVVIGSGVAGLTAAVAFATLEREVTVLERAPRPAPLVSGFDRGRHYCDVGLHYTGGLEPGGFLHCLLDRLGVLDQIDSVALRADGFDRLLWPATGRDICIPTGLEAAEDRLARAFPASRPAVHAWAEATRTALVETPLLNPGLPPAEWGVSASDWTSLADFLRSHRAEPELVTVLGSYGEVLCGLSAEEIPLSTHAVVVGSYIRSARTIRGGGRALVAALLSAADRLGVEFRGGCEVDAIQADGDGRVGAVVLADGRRLDAGTVVFTPHPALLPGMLGSQRTREAYRRRLDRCSNTSAMFLAFIEAQDDDLATDQNVYVFPAQNGPHRPRVLALMSGSPPAAGRLRTRCLIRPADLADFGDPDRAGQRPRPEGYRVAKELMAGAALEELGHHLPGVGRRTPVHETLSPWSFAEWTGTAEGSAYGLKRPVSGYRLRSRTPLRELFLAGQSLLAPGIMGAAASALVACCNSAGAERTWQALF